MKDMADFACKRPGPFRSDAPCRFRRPGRENCLQKSRPGAPWRKTRLAFSGVSGYGEQPCRLRPSPDENPTSADGGDLKKRRIVFPEGNWRSAARGGKAIPECAFPELGARVALFEEADMDAEKNEDQTRQSGDGAIPEREGMSLPFPEINAGIGESGDAESTESPPAGAAGEAEAESAPTEVIRGAGRVSANTGVQRSALPAEDDGLKPGDPIPGEEGVRVKPDLEMLREVPFLDSLYNETYLYLIPREPETMFVIWEVGEEIRKSLRERFGEDFFRKNRLILRIYQVTGIVFNGSHAHSSFEVDDWLADKTEFERATVSK